MGGPGAVEIRSGEMPELLRAVQALAAAKHRDWSLWAAVIDPGIAVRRFTREGTGEFRCFSAEELAAQNDPSVWQAGAEIDTRRGLLGREAEELRVARFLAGSFDEFKQIYHLDEHLTALEPNWAHVLVERLSTPHIAGMLLFVAWFTLLVELSHPGLSVAGFLSMLCFIVYFWSQFLHGTAGWLEVLLFAAGAISVLIEVFVIPGVGIFGLGGGLLIVASIILASQTFVIPRNSYQLEQLPGSLFMVAAGGAGAFASLVMMRRYLADAPILKRLMLPPPDAEDSDDLARRRR